MRGKSKNLLYKKGSVKLPAPDRRRLSQKGLQKVEEKLRELIILKSAINRTISTICLPYSDPIIKQETIAIHIKISMNRDISQRMQTLFKKKFIEEGLGWQKGLEYNADEVETMLQQWHDNTQKEIEDKKELIAYNEKVK